MTMIRYQQDDGGGTSKPAAKRRGGTIHFRFDGADETACGSRGVYVNELTVATSGIGGYDAYIDKYGARACADCIEQGDPEVDMRPSQPLPPPLIHITVGRKRRTANGTVKPRPVACGKTAKRHSNETSGTRTDIKRWLGQGTPEAAICAACRAAA